MMLHSLALEAQQSGRKRGGSIRGERAEQTRRVRYVKIVRDEHRVRAALNGRTRVECRATVAPASAADDRLHGRVLRRRRGDGRRENEPRRRSPAAVEERSVGGDRRKGAGRWCRNELSRRPDPDEDLLCVKSSPRLR